MPDIRPQLDSATVEAFLHQQLGAPIEDLRRLRGGEICTAFAYSLAGERYVIRFSANKSGFLLDQLAQERFTPAGIPIPRIYQIGQFGEQAFAISAYAPSSTILHLPAARQEALAPVLIEMLDRIHQIDVHTTSGYGELNDVGMGHYPSWAAYLKAIENPDPDHFYGRWTRLFDESFLEQPLYEQVLAEMTALLPFCPEERSLVHGDYGSDNVIVDGERLTAILDWANMKYGDFLFDVAWLNFWPTPLDYVDLFQRHYAEGGRAVPHYTERVRCYTCYIGLIALRFFAHTGQRAPYDWAGNRVRSLLGMGT